MLVWNDSGWVVLVVFFSWCSILAGFSNALPRLNSVVKMEECRGKGKWASTALAAIRLPRQEHDMCRGSSGGINSSQEALRPSHCLPVVDQILGLQWMQFYFHKGTATREWSFEETCLLGHSSAGNVFCACASVNFNCSPEEQLLGHVWHTDDSGGWPHFPVQSCFTFSLMAFPDWLFVTWLMAGVCMERWLLLSRLYFVMSAPGNSNFFLFLFF